MEFGIISVIPVVVMVVGSLITKRLIEMSIISSVLAGILLFQGEFLTAYTDQFYTTLAGETYSAIFFILMGFGAIIELARSTGALNGFALALGKFANSRRKSLFITYILGWILFADDYLLTLGSCYTMRNITDKHGVPREHLALMGILSANNVCVIVPVTSWAVFNIATAKKFGYDVGMYIETIPYLFYPIIAMIILLLLALEMFPKLGTLKASYKRVEEGGPLWEKSELEKAVDEELEELENDEEVMGPLYFFLPLIILIVVTVSVSIELGMLAALTCQFIMYVFIKRIKAAKFFETMFAGFKDMTQIAFVILMVCTMSEMSIKMGVDKYLINLIVGNVPAWILPAMFFIAVLIVTMTSDGWASIALAVPIMLPMAIAAGVPLTLAYGAIISGSSAGVASCLFSDSMFMASACTGIPNDRELKVNAPYVGISVVIALILFLVVSKIVC